MIEFINKREECNVIDKIKGGGGNYPLYDGFGWTNRVYLRFIQR